MLRIVIVEDEDIIRRGLVCTIDWMAMGCMVVGDAPDGESGLALIEQERPDLVLTDIRMPKMDGIEMITAAKTLSGLSFRTIFITSYADFEYARQAVKLQAIDYLLKPIDEEELGKAIKKLNQAKAEQKDSAWDSVQTELVDWDAYLKDDNFMNTYVRQALCKVRDSYREKISIEAIADELAVSPSYLSRKFKESTSQTFGEILTKYRIQKAAQLLSTGTYRIYEVAEMAGFGDYKNFCLVFKKQMHISPKKFMNRVSGIIQREDINTDEKL
jgi:two-component system, response regulator YesN